MYNLYFYIYWGRIGKFEKNDSIYYYKRCNTKWFECYCVKGRSKLENIIPNLISYLLDRFPLLHLII